MHVAYIYVTISMCNPINLNKGVSIKSYFGIILAAAVGALLTLGITGQFNSSTSPTLTLASPTGNPAWQARMGGEAPLDFSQAAEVSMPSVVHIASFGTQRRGGQAFGQQIPDIFKDFFGDQFGQGQRPQQEGQRRSMGSGSGVILTEDGYIVTNNHVIDGSESLTVTLNNNQTYEAEIVGVDPSTDLALIKVDASNLTPAILANSDEVRVGEWVLAVGNPFSLNSTVTAGIVSAKARNINILRDRAAIESFIQTDAAVNPGNSGGALVNLNGELVGINTAIASPTGSYSGYAFAIPTNLMRKVIQDLMEFGEVQRGYLGVIIRNVNGNLAEEKDITLTEGVYVDSLMPNSAAKEAGIQTGDVIVSIDGRPTKTSSELQAAVGIQRPGDAVDIVVNRNGSEKTLSVTLKNAKGNTEILTAADRASTEMLGASWETLSADEASDLGLRGGVRLNDLGRGKLQDQTDIEEGFIVTHVNNEPVMDAEELKTAINQAEGGVMLEGRYSRKPGRYFYAFGM